MIEVQSYFELHVGFQIFGLNMSQRCFVQNLIYDFHNMYRYFGGKLRGREAYESTRKCGSDQAKCNKMVFFVLVILEINLQNDCLLKSINHFFENYLLGVIFKFSV